MSRFIKPLIAIFAVNIAVIVGINIILYALKVFFGVDLYTTYSTYDLLIWSAIVGFASAFISLFLSKWMVKFLYKIQIVDPQRLYEYDEKIQFLYNKLKYLSEKEGIPVPEFGIYESPEPNAFATGCGLCGRLIAFSTGILQVMDKDELEGVLGHEFAHVTNGDMVTTTILQGFLNTVVIFLARFIANIVASRDSNEPNPLVYFLVSIILEIVFGIIASLILAWYSRIREYAADRDSALKYADKYKMAKALEKLKIISEQGVPVDPNNETVATLKIYNFGGKILNLFSTHPPLEERIQRVLSY